MNRRKFKKLLRNNYKDMMYSYAYAISSIKFRKWIESDRRLQVIGNNFRNQLECTPRYRIKLRGYE